MAWREREEKVYKEAAALFLFSPIRNRFPIFLLSSTSPFPSPLPALPSLRRQDALLIN